MDEEAATHSRGQAIEAVRLDLGMHQERASPSPSHRALDHSDHLGGIGSNRLRNRQDRVCLHSVLVVEPGHCVHHRFGKECECSDLDVLLCGHSAIFSSQQPEGSSQTFHCVRMRFMPLLSDLSLGLRSPAFHTAFRPGHFRPGFSFLDLRKSCSLVIFLHRCDQPMFTCREKQQTHARSSSKSCVSLC
jgi:hypothetical protein